MREIGKKTFDDNDQIRFALISSDRNPMHMDPIAARRLLTGRQVVHGIHIVLTAVELWEANDKSGLVSVRCTFNNPVCVGDEVVFTQKNTSEHAYSIEATVKGLLCSRIVIAADPNARAGLTGPRRQTGEGPYSSDKPLAAPLNEPPEFHVGRPYLIKFNDGNFSSMFPNAYRRLGRINFSAIAALSYFVGMVCPGLHSIFSAFSLEVDDSAANRESLNFSVQKYDERYRLFDIAFQGPIRGSLKAFLRPPPQEQPALGEISARVSKKEFDGIKALIIGGSRGLGEITARILAAGGADLLVTYASGLDDARKIQKEINAYGAGKCELLRLDLTKDSYTTLDIDFDSIDVVYFFATPRIYRRSNELFETGRFTEFFEFYIKSFYELCALFENRLTEDKRVKVFFPSSVFVSDRPKGMTEYSMVKAAAEILIEEINKSFGKISVLSSRLPRLQTDQTASVLRVSTASNLETLLPIIREILGRNSG